MRKMRRTSGCGCSVKKSYVEYLGGLCRNCYSMSLSDQHNRIMEMNFECGKCDRIRDDMIKKIHSDYAKMVEDRKETNGVYG